MQQFAERGHFSFSGKLHSLRSVRFLLGQYAKRWSSCSGIDETFDRLLVVAIQEAWCDVGSSGKILKFLRLVGRLSLNSLTL